MLVSNSVHWDPRVRKEATICSLNGFNVVVVGIIEPKFNRKEIDLLPFRVSLLNNPFKNNLLFCGIIGNSLWRFLYNIYYVLGFFMLCILERADVYHCNDFNTLPMGWLAAKILRVKVVYDTHEIATENVGWFSTRPTQKKILRFFESFFIHRVDAVISVSHSAAKFLGDLYKIEPPRVITNCAWSMVKQNICSSAISKPFEVLCHGQFYDGRGYDLLIKAARFLKSYEGKIVIVLRGYGKSEEKYRQLVIREKAESFIRFDPPVMVDELVLAASKSDVGVAITEGICDNFKYSISNKIFEYLSAGLPVLMSDIPEHKFYNQLYHFGIIFVDLDPQTIARTIIKLYQDKLLYIKIKENVIDAQKTLCWEVEGAKLFVLYHNLLK